MTQSLLTKLIWVVLIIIIAAGIGYTQNKSGTATLGPWVYQAMGLLHQKGYLADYPEDWVNSGNQLSRFEMAYYIKEFIVKQKNISELPSGIVEVLQKLIAEFRTELTDLGIQVTDINKISPNLETTDKSNDYQDLDNIIPRTNDSNKVPCYYYGQYFSELQRKEFLFIPYNYVQSRYIFLLESSDSNINIVYQPKLATDPSFLVVKGYLPISGQQSIVGYYLFPIEGVSSEPANVKSSINTTFNNSVLSLLDEVNQMQKIDSLWEFNGILHLDGYLPMETDFKSQLLVGNLDQGLKIGSFLIYSDNPLIDSNFVVNNFGLPTYNPHLPSTAIDLDSINGKYLQSIQINISGSMSLSSQTSLFGGLDVIYRGTNIGLDNICPYSIWPSDTKASAGLNFHFSDYWSILTYQSFVNSQLDTGLLSTTSVGFDYEAWVTLWLAYQLLNFDKPVLSGTVALRF